MSAINSLASNPSIWGGSQTRRLHSSRGSGRQDFSLNTVKGSGSAQAPDSADATDATSALVGPQQVDAGDQSQATQGGQRQNRFDTALADQGISGTQLSDLRTQIKSAADDAKSNGSDPRDAIDSVLKNAGIDLDQFKQDLGTRPQGGPGGPGSVPPQGPPPDGAQPTDSTSSSSTSSIDQVLQNSGIDPTKFKSQLQTLLADPNSSASSFSSLFSGANKGSEVDVVG